MTATTEDVWREFSDGLRAFIRSRVSSDADADDVLSDVFVKVHAGIGSLRDDRRIGPWLYRITRNAVVDHYRRRPSDQPLGGFDRAAPADEDDDTAARGTAAYLGTLVRDLPDPYRDALMLTEFEGLTQVEAADRLGLSVSGAKSRIQRGRAMLKDQMLACCHFELDRRGHVIGIEPRPPCCDEASQAEG